MARTKPKSGRAAKNGTHTIAQPVSKKSTKAKKVTNGNGNGHPIEDYFTPEQLRQLAGFFDNRELLRVLTEVKNGNFSVRMPIDQVGISGKICDTLNDIIAMNEKMERGRRFAKYTHLRPGAPNHRNSTRDQLGGKR
jgi:hypothetical protein